MELSGWIKLHRKLLKTSWFKNPSAAHLAIYCLLKAYWTEGNVLWGQSERLLFPGQFRTGTKVLSTETGLTRQQLRTSLTILSKTNFLTIESTNLGSIITVIKYKDYQILEKDQPTNQPTLNQPLTNPQPTPNQPLTTNEEVKKLKKLKNLRKDQILTVSDSEKESSTADDAPKISKAIKIYQDVFLRYPDKTQWPGINETVYESESSLARWEKACREYVKLNKKPTNFRMLLDWYENGIQDWIGGKLVRRQPEYPVLGENNEY